MTTYTQSQQRRRTTIANVFKAAKSYLTSSGEYCEIDQSRYICIAIGCTSFNKIDKKLVRNIIANRLGVPSIAIAQVREKLP